MQEHAEKPTSDEKPTTPAGLVLAKAQAVGADVYRDGLKRLVSEIGNLGTPTFRFLTAPLRALLFGAERLEEELGARVERKRSPAQHPPEYIAGPVITNYAPLGQVDETPEVDASRDTPAILASAMTDQATQPAHSSFAHVISQTSPTDARIAWCAAASDPQCWDGARMPETSGTPWFQDAVTRLRIRGEAGVLPLMDGRSHYVIGSASDQCDFVLTDPTGQVSRKHAALMRRGTNWVIHDLGSTNGIRQDGEWRTTFELWPGVEVKIGEVRLVAESEQSMRLHDYLRRLIGWADNYRDEVDLALQAVRDATRGAVLLLCGQGDLVPLARRLHRMVFGDQLFVSDDAMPADPSAGSTVCIAAKRLTPELVREYAARRARGVPLHLIVHAYSQADAAVAASKFEMATTMVQLRAPGFRPGDEHRLLRAYVADVVADWSLATSRIHEHEWERLAGLKPITFADVETLARRVVAVRNWGLFGAAERLEVSPSAISKWFGARRITLSRNYAET